MVVETLAKCFRLALAPSADATGLGKSAKAALDQVCERICAMTVPGGAPSASQSDWLDVVVSSSHSNAQVDELSALDALVFLCQCICTPGLELLFRSWALAKRLEMSTVSSSGVVALLFVLACIV
jgi:hypothetical protein